MLKDFFQALIAHADLALQPKFSRPDAEPKHVYCVVARDGHIEWREAEPAPRQHQARDLATIAAWAKGIDEEKSAAIWYDRTGVVLLLDDATRRDRVCLAISPHPVFARLVALESSKEWMDQKTFLSLFRVWFGLYCEPNPEEAIRRLRFRKNEAGETHIQVSKVSLGRQIEREISGGSEIPDHVDLTLPVFAGILSSYRQLVSCLVEIDPEQEKFRLLPVPGETEAAIGLAEAHIGDDLRCELQNVVPVYYGSP